MSIDEILGFALGCIGMSFQDFGWCTPSEFNEIVRAYNDREDTKSRERWEQTRILAAIVIQPHIKKSIAPRKLLPLPWDREQAQHSNKESIAELARMVGK